MRLIEGTPEEIAEFLRQMDMQTTGEPLRMALPHLDFAPPAPEPDTEKPPAQTIAPVAIEKMEFGLDSAGAPVDVAAVHRRIGELLRSAGFQKHAAQNLPPLDAFEAPMMHAKRFMIARCVRDNLFDLAALDALCALYVQPQQAPNTVAGFSGAQPYAPGSVTVTFEGK